MLFIWYPNCSTCQKAKALLDEGNVVYTLRDIKINKPSIEELREWYEESGISLRKFFNTSGVLYKEMGLKDKIDKMSDEQMLKLLAADGMLVKRPLLISENKIVIGYKKEEYLAIRGE